MFMPFHVYEYVEYGKMYIFVVMLLWLSLIVAQKHESLSLVYETLLCRICIYLPWAKAQDED